MVLAYFKNDIKASIIGKTILRLYGGIFETPSTINLQLVASKSGQTIPIIIQTLEQMERDGLLTLQLHTTDAVLTFNVPREDDKTINPIAREIRLQKEKKVAQVASVIRYIENETVCKSVQLAYYFGETDATACGICSVCRVSSQKISTKKHTSLANQVLTLLEQGPQTSRELIEKGIFAETDVLDVLRSLLDAKKISLDVRNRYHLK